jgi:hypothetical protein
VGVRAPVFCGAVFDAIGALFFVGAFELFFAAAFAVVAAFAPFVLAVSALASVLSLFV